MDLNVECAYNVNDETLNFGYRGLAENESYESVTLATVKIRELKYDTTQPWINARLQNGQIFYSINDSFGIFKDSQCTSAVTSCTFPNIVDVIFISPNNSLAYIFLRNGSIHFLKNNIEKYIMTDTAVLIPNQENNVEKFFIDCHLEFFHETEKSSEISSIITTKSGQVFRLKVFEMEDSKLSCEHEIILDLMSFVKHSAFSNSLLFLNGTKNWIFDISTGDVESTEALDIKYVTFTGLRILALLSSGELISICPMTLLEFFIEIDFPVRSFFVQLDENNNLKHIVLNSKKDNYLYLLNSDFSSIYRLKVPNNILLITPASLIDEVFYISLVESHDDMRELRFHCVYGTDPDKRLAILCRRQMFDEAETFAKAHSLDVSTVNIERAKCILAKPQCTSSDINELIKILGSMRNKAFVLDCCSNVESTCQNPDDIMKILKYGCELSIDKHDTTARERQLLCRELYLRFNLFLSLGYDIKKWGEFSTYSTLINDLKIFLKNSEISKAITLYSNISKREIETFSVEDINQVLDILDDFDIDAVVPFLAVFIPRTCKTLQTLPNFLNWIQNKVYQIEKLYVDDFPKKAIEFLQTTAKYVKIKNGKFPVQSDPHVRCESLKKLLKYLMDLDVLKSEYGVRISLTEFMKEPTDVVKALLSLELSQDVYSRLLEKFVFHYILDNELNADEIFWRTVMDLLSYQESYWINIVGAILNCISSIQIKVLVVKNILLIADLPWSKKVRELGLRMLQNSNPIVSEIRDIMDREQQIIVLNREEYELQSTKRITVDNVQYLINKIVKCNLPTMVSDVFQLCQSDNLKIEAMRLLFLHFVEEGNFQEAFKVVDDKNKNVVKQCLSLILGEISALSEYLDTSEADNYIYAITAPDVTRKYESVSENDFEALAWKDNIESLKNFHYLEKHFDVHLPRKIISMEEKKQIVNQILTKLISQFENKSLSAADIINSCHRLHFHCEVSKEKLLLQCCMGTEVDKTELLCRVAEEFLSSCDKVKYLSVLTVYLLRNLSDKNENVLSENSFIDYNTSVVITDHNLGILLKLALELITKAVNLADSEELPACLKIAQWVECIYFLRRQKRADDDDIHIFDNTFNTSSLDVTLGSLLAIQTVFTLYTMFIGRYNNDEYRFLTYFNRKQETISQVQFLNEIKNISRLMYVPNQDGELLLPYKLFTTLHTQLLAHPDLDDEISNTLTEIIKTQCIPNLIHHTVSMETVNENLFHTCLLCCSSEEVLKTVERALKLHKMSPENVAVISKVAVGMFEHHRNFGPQYYCKGVLLNVFWWYKVKHLDINYNTFFKLDHRKRLELLLNTDEFDFNLIKEYCNEYNLEDVQSYHLKYLKNFLLNWKPKYEIVTKPTGERYLLMSENQEQELSEKCVTIIKLIIDKEKVVEIMNEIWCRVNFYHYEVFHCILSVSEGHTYKHLESMLLFLKNYKRINPPGHTEKEKWFSSFPECQCLDPLSEFRLLFNSTLLDSHDIWDVIRKEISLKNYKVWLQAVHAFNYLTVDKICSFLVEELVAQGVLNGIKLGDWLYPKYTDLFNEIDECLQHMNNIDMRKTATAYCLLSNTPDGADQVTIAKMTYRYAKEYQSQDVTCPSVISFTKVEKKYQRSLSLQILHSYNLANAAYIDLILNVEQLFLALYYDERIIDRVKYVNLHCPDINRAIDQLAEVYELDVVKFREKMISQCLMDSELKDMSLDISLGFSGHTSLLQRENLEKSRNNLIRAAYVCSSDLPFWQKHLIEEEVKCRNNPDESSLYYRSRCMKCLLEIADEIQIKLLTSQDLQTFTKTVDELMLSSMLSKFGIKFIGDKNYLRTVMKKLAQIGSLESIQTLAETCKFLSITKEKYWEYIIKKSLQFNQFSDLREYLDYTEKENYRFQGYYIDAWQKLVDHTLLSTLSSNEDDIEEKLLTDLDMIQECPVIFFLNFEHAIDRCNQAKRIGPSLILAQYLPNEKRSVVLKNIKNNNKLEDLLEQLKTFKNHGLVTDIATNILTG